MPHSKNHDNDHENRHGRARNPSTTHAYLVGGGIASLAAASHLIHDAHVPAAQVHIIESSLMPGGSMDGSGSPEHGYVARGGRMLNFSYLCLYDLLSTIPSLTDPKKTVMAEIHEFNQVPGNKTHANARIVAQGAQGPETLNVAKFGLRVKDKEDLLMLMVKSEDNLNITRIDEVFQPDFFTSNFWFMWATMFAFQPWHSAVEFRRYLHRFVHEFPRINTLAGVDRTPYNQFDSIILPITSYLIGLEVDFRYGTKVLDLSFAKGNLTEVEVIHTISDGVTGIINVHSADIVIITLGSMTAGSSAGTNTSPPPLPPVVQSASDDSWALWTQIARNRPSFGNPTNFSSRIQESNWESFTVTLKDPEFLNRLTSWTGNPPGTGALITFKDSNWLMSIVVPHQPHFLNQPKNVQVMWGYGLSPWRAGNHVTKPMSACSGQEIMTELLGHLAFPLQPTLDNSITLPCMLPYITSQFLTRAYSDRPQVIPAGSTNLAFVGQFVEIPLDVVFTVEYSVRGAQMAVFGLMGMNKRPRCIYKGEHDPKIMAAALKTLLFS